jgi:hypothetical protein
MASDVSGAVTSATAPEDASAVSGGVTPATAPEEGAAKFTDSLSFIDLLYAVPVADLATRVAEADIDRVPAFEWAVLAACITVLVLSWIGLHNNRAEMEIARRHPVGDFPFLSLRFVQFLLEVVIVGLYFVMGLKLDIPNATSTVPSPTISWPAGVIVVVYIAYLIWDTLDALQAKRDNNSKWLRPAIRGGAVSALFVIIFAVGYLFLLPHSYDGCTAYASLIALLQPAYRIIQEQVRGQRRSPVAP